MIAAVAIALASMPSTVVTQIPAEQPPRQQIETVQCSRALIGHWRVIYNDEISGSSDETAAIVQIHDDRSITIRWSAEDVLSQPTCTDQQGPDGQCLRFVISDGGRHGVYFHGCLVDETIIGSSFRGSHRGSHNWSARRMPLNR